MPLFKKRPLIVEAIQYQPGKPFEIEMFVGSTLKRLPGVTGIAKAPLEIETANGKKDLDETDWLIRETNINGNLTVKTNEQFEKEYEPAVKKRQPKEIPEIKNLKAPVIPTPSKEDKPGSKA